MYLLLTIESQPLNSQYKYSVADFGAVVLYPDQSRRFTAELCDNLACAGFIGSDLSHKSVAGSSQRTKTFQPVRVATTMPHKEFPPD